MEEELKPSELSVADLGMAIHTALRKACDSKPTTILYNVICELDRKIWVDWLECVQEILKADTEGRPAAVLDIKRMSHNYDYSRRLFDKDRSKAQKLYEGRDKPAKRKFLFVMQMFELALQICDVQDFDGMMSFVYEEGF